MIVVSDFQCPYCKQWHDQTYPALLNEYVKTGKVRVAYVNYPLAMHAQARPTAEAAMCAGAQGKFWQMHDAIFATQARWSRLPSADTVFAGLARGVGLEMSAWRRCMSSHAMMPLIEADRDRAVQAGVNSTPSFFIGTTQISGAYPADSFRVAIDSALARARTR